MINFKTEELRKNLLEKYLEIDEAELKENQSTRRTSFQTIKGNFLNLSDSSASGLENEAVKLLEKKEKKECNNESKRARMQCVFNELGVSDLVIDLFTSEISSKLFKESMLLAIAMLEGGNRQVQVFFRKRLKFLYLKININFN